MLKEGAPVIIDPYLLRLKIINQVMHNAKATKQQASWQHYSLHYLLLTTMVLGKITLVRNSRPWFKLMAAITALGTVVYNYFTAQKISQLKAREAHLAQIIKAHYKHLLTTEHGNVIIYTNSYLGHKLLLNNSQFIIEKLESNPSPLPNFLPSRLHLAYQAKEGDDKLVDLAILSDQSGEFTGGKFYCIDNKVIYLADNPMTWLNKLYNKLLPHVIKYTQNTSNLHLAERRVIKLFFKALIAATHNYQAHAIGNIIDLDDELKAGRSNICYRPIMLGFLLNKLQQEKIKIDDHYLLADNLALESRVINGAKHSWLTYAMRYIIDPIRGILGPKAELKGTQRTWYKMAYQANKCG